MSYQIGAAVLALGFLGEGLDINFVIQNPLR